MKAPAVMAVVVPIKSFGLAKARLTDVLTPPERRQLAIRCAEAVLAAARPLPVYVVCDDVEVAEWATAHNATIVVPPEPGLNAAVAAGRTAAERAGHGRVLVVHSDLPNAQTLASLGDIPAAVVVVPDRHGDGTNALLLPSEGAFNFQYGPGSSTAHAAEATRLGLTCQVVARPDLALDLDTLDDLRVGGFTNLRP